MPSSRHTNGWNLGCVPSVPTQLIIYIDVSPVISYGCIWLFQWEHENHPLVLWGSPIDAPSVVARRQGPLFWQWKFGGLRNGRTPELEKSGFDSYGYIC